MKLRINKILTAILITAFLWLCVSNVIQAFNCPELSQTQLFIRLPKSFIGQWKSC